MSFERVYLCALKKRTTHVKIVKGYEFKVVVRKGMIVCGVTKNMASNDVSQS